MQRNAEQILKILDDCSEKCTFPMFFETGYVYPIETKLAASRLSLFSSEENWAIVIEIFGYYPRIAMPHIHTYSFSNKLHNRKEEAEFPSEQAHQNYLRNNPYNEFRYFYPIKEDLALGHDFDEIEILSKELTEITLRDNKIKVPQREDYTKHKITLEDNEHIQAHELCRYLAEIKRDQVLANNEEIRESFAPGLEMILQLDEWDHPDLPNGELPGTTESFKQFAKILETGDISIYQPTQPPNTHWSNWPEAITL